MGSILIVDDDAGVLSAFVHLLRGEGHEVHTAGHAEAALACVERQSPDLVIMDIRMPGMSGLEAFERIKAIAPKLPVIIMTGYSTMDTAIQATKMGAYDYLVKPLVPESTLQAVSGALECVRLMSGKVSMDAEEEQIPAEDVLVGQSAAIQEVFKRIGRVASTDATVLICGETGTGKELVARAIYQHSNRFDKPLVVVNCAAIPDTLLESELFGHERGAFTGASHRRIGKFEQAAGGTLFLDEVGDMPLAIQAKLLRVLQEGVVERLGGGESIRVDVRILAATNRDLKKSMAKGAFRKDLFHRLQVFTIHLPPLRDRPEDIPRLARYFMQRFSRNMGFDSPSLTDEATRLLVAHPWPGNVRELKHTIHRALISTGGYPFQEETLRWALEQNNLVSGDEFSTDLEKAFRRLAQRLLAKPSGSDLFTLFTETAERALIIEALALTNGNQTRAAELLGMARPTLKSKMDKYGIMKAPPIP